MENPYKNRTGLSRLLRALANSLAGIKSACRHECAFRQELLLAVVLIPLAVVLGENALARALMIASVLLVLIVELLNSSIEAAVDRVSLEHHELAGRAKDIASAAVLLSLVNLLVVWGLLLLD